MKTESLMAEWLAGAVALAALAASCSGQGTAKPGMDGGPGPGGHVASPGAGAGAGGKPAGPDHGPGPGAGAGSGGVTGGNHGGGGVSVGSTCTPGVQQTLVSDCGYPYASSRPLTSVVFNESDVLRAIVASGGWPMATVSLFYDDEHALTLGVRNTVVKGASGTTTTDYPVSALPSVPGSVTSPATGTNVLAGDQSGLDTSLRPMWPALFITDITSDPTSRAGDWQMGGVPHNPTAVFGTWKAAVRTVDNTQSPPLVTITPDADPAKNKQVLGSGAATFPSGIKDEGFGAEVRWNVSLLAGHSYRLQVMVHDGDQNKAGGDSGEACVTFCAAAGCSECGSDGSGGKPGCSECGSDGSGGGCAGEGLTSCSGDGVTDSCPAGTACANGCCLVPL